MRFLVALALFAAVVAAAPAAEAEAAVEARTCNKTSYNRCVSGCYYSCSIEGPGPACTKDCVPVCKKAWGC